MQSKQIAAADVAGPKYNIAHKRSWLKNQAMQSTVIKQAPHYAHEIVSKRSVTTGRTSEQRRQFYNSERIWRLIISSSQMGGTRSILW